MPLFKTPFTKNEFFTETVDTTVHPLFDSIKPLTPKEMLQRSVKGLPLNVRDYSSEERIMFNNRFFGSEKLDVYDSIRLEQKRLQEKKDKGTVEALSSTVPADTAKVEANTPQDNNNNS